MPAIDEKITSLDEAVAALLGMLMVVVDPSDTSMAPSGTDLKMSLETLIDTLLKHELAIQVINPQTGNYTPTVDDVGALIIVTSAVDRDFTMPETGTVAIPIGGWMDVIQLGAGAVNFVPQGGIASYKTDGVGARVRLQVIATDTWHMDGKLTEV